MQQDADFITAEFLYMFRASCAHHQEYKILTWQPPVQVVMVAGRSSLCHIRDETDTVSSLIWQSEDPPATITTCTGSCCQHFILLMMGAWRPKHVEKFCSNKICILLHYVSVLFNLIQWFQFIWYPGQCLSQPLNHYSHFSHHVSLTNENLPANFSPEALASHYHIINAFYSIWDGKKCIWNTMQKHIRKLCTAEPRTRYVRNSANITKWIKLCWLKQQSMSEPRDYGHAVYTTVFHFHGNWQKQTSNLNGWNRIAKKPQGEKKWRGEHALSEEFLVWKAVRDMQLLTPMESLSIWKGSKKPLDDIDYNQNEECISLNLLTTILQ